MITICLCGILAEERRRFEVINLQTQIRWIDLSVSQKEVAATDLFVWLKEDPEASRATPSLPLFTVVWTKLPAEDELDRKLQASLTEVYGFVVGYTDAMHQLCRSIRVLTHPMARALDLRCLVLGETGVGKELIAQAIHRLGPRRDKPFLPVNCASMSPELALSELFGHVRGAFTSAIANRQGALSAATGGVLFLDEIANLPGEVQGQLLRVLEQRTFSAVGTNSVSKLDAQIIAATNRDLVPLVERGVFRADLYFRIAQTTIRVPSLAERIEDLDLLVHYFWYAANARVEVEHNLVATVKARRWPGNVRELRSAVEHLVVLRAAGDPSPMEQVFGTNTATEQEGENRTLAVRRAQFERGIIEAVLRRTGYDTAAAARELGVTRRTIYNLVKRYRIRLPS
jgi:transcriptional regulator with GAF, ATPase, and Fis domain